MLDAYSIAALVLSPNNRILQHQLTTASLILQPFPRFEHHPTSRLQRGMDLLRAVLRRPAVGGRVEIRQDPHRSVLQLLVGRRHICAESLRCQQKTDEQPTKPMKTQQNPTKYWKT